MSSEHNGLPNGTQVTNAETSREIEHGIWIYGTEAEVAAEAKSLRSAIRVYPLRKIGWKIVESIKSAASSIKVFKS